MNSLEWMLVKYWRSFCLHYFLAKWVFIFLAQDSFCSSKLSCAWAKNDKVVLKFFQQELLTDFKLTQNTTNSKTFDTFFHRKQPTLKPNRYVFIRIASRSHGKIGLWAHLIIYDLWILQSENRLAKHLGSDIHVQK